MVIPIVQNVYLVNNNQADNLVNLLKKMGFSIHPESGRDDVTALRNLKGLEAYIARHDDKARVTLTTDVGEYGIHPEYLDSLIRDIRGAGIEIKEIPGERRYNPHNPFDWSTPQGAALLVGHSSRQ